MAVKYTAADLQRLQRTVDNFNAKVRRAAARGVEGLPEPVRVREIKAEAVSRSDLNRTLNALERFSRKGAERTVTIPETGLTLTRWEKAEFNRQAAITVRRQKERLAKYGEVEATSRGRPLGVKRNAMLSTRLNELEASKRSLSTIRTRSELKAAKQTIAKRIRSDYYKVADERMKANYIQGLRTVFGSRADPLIARIQAMPASEVVRTAFRDQEGNISFIYDPVAMNARFDAIMDVWGMDDSEGEDAEEFDLE